MTKNEAYRYLAAQDKTTSWIANVFLTAGGPNCAASLKALATLVRQGVSVSPLSFTMPHDSLLVDGQAMTPAQIRERATRCYGK
jgi:tryptophan synthase alpha subunit